MAAIPDDGLHKNPGHGAYLQRLPSPLALALVGRTGGYMHGKSTALPEELRQELSKHGPEPLNQPSPPNPKPKCGP